MSLSVNVSVWPFNRLVPTVAGTGPSHPVTPKEIKLVQKMDLLLNKA